MSWASDMEWGLGELAVRVVPSQPTHPSLALREVTSRDSALRQHALSTTAFVDVSKTGHCSMLCA